MCSSENIWPAQNVRAFVGATAWEELARQWVAAQRATNALGFSPEVVGSHWSRTAQIDVVAINWQTRDILLGECKWGADAVDRATVRELLARAPLVLADLPNAGANWRVHYAFFVRTSATPPPNRSLLRSKDVLLIWRVCTQILLHKRKICFYPTLRFRYMGSFAATPPEP
jgi:uncharacterized protein